MSTNESGPRPQSAELNSETFPAGSQGAAAVAGSQDVAAADVAAGGAPTAPAAAAAITNSEVQAAAERLNTKRWGYRFVKRAFDIVFSICILILFCWLFALIALAIKLDNPKGNVIFKQIRVTKDGRRFKMYKFRSMCTDAEEHLNSLRKSNEKTSPVFKMRDDPRVTRVGRFLRKVSLDELPQFVNVLKGDLSVVGPRPALVCEVEEYTPYQAQRLLVKAGITCFWQTRRDRDSISFDEWVDLDLLYIEKCGVWTDCKLIVQTIGCVLTAQGN